MNKIICALLFIFILSSSFHQRDTTHTDTNAATVIDNPAKARIDATLKSFVDSGKVAGVSALIFEKNKEVYYNAFGLQIAKQRFRWTVKPLYVFIQ